MKTLQIAFAVFIGATILLPILPDWVSATAFGLMMAGSAYLFVTAGSRRDLW